MSFINSAEAIIDEHEERFARVGKNLTFGVGFLDDAAYGIIPNDLILIGARSGAGKTQLCCNIAAANIAKGKRVHFMALEAEPLEIERRIKFQLIAKKFYAENQGQKLSFQRWMMGEYRGVLDRIDAEATRELLHSLQGWRTYYKSGPFDVHEMTRQVVMCAKETDLIIIDHVHYFDFEDDNENRAIREIAKMARTLTLEEGKPIVLVAHLRKRDKFNPEMAPSLEEFHGSSDLYKIATKVITMAPGEWVGDGRVATYFRVPKNRFEGSVVMNIARVNFLQREGRYEESYELGDLKDNRGDSFVGLDRALPEWASRATRILAPYPGGGGDAVVRRGPIVNHADKWKTIASGRKDLD